MREDVSFLLRAQRYAARTMYNIATYHNTTRTIKIERYSAKSTTHRCSQLTIRAGRKTTGALRTFSCYAVVNIPIRAKLKKACVF